MRHPGILIIHTATDNHSKLNGGLITPTADGTENAPSTITTNPATANDANVIVSTTDAAHSSIFEETWDEAIVVTRRNDHVCVVETS
jgi:hypothetical protein